jgi:hypothetical protein
MKTSARRIVLSLAAVAFLFPTLTALAADPWVGQKFMPRDGCKWKVGDKEVPAQFFNLPYVVTKVNGDWLWIGRAWTKKTDLVPLDQAGAYYTEYLRNNPAKSWGYARKVCELTEWKTTYYFDTLAAACAEAGEFDEALKWEAKAVDGTTDEKEKVRFQSRLDLYKAGKRYRDEPEPKAN